MKTRSLIALASFAGLAHATESSSTVHNRTPNGVPFTLDIDFSGYQFWDEQGSLHNEVYEIFIAPHCCITAISWDMNLTTLTAPGQTFPSWASEATLDIEGLWHIPIADAQHGVINQNFQGSVAFPEPIQLSPDNILTIELFESFDDQAMSPDAILEAGSVLTLHGNCLPTPSICASFMLCGFLSTRRKRVSHS